MYGDFSRNAFRRNKHYSSVRKQQGRVELDADWNEQGDIERYRSRSADGDVIGFHGGPKGSDAKGNPLAGFAILPAGNDTFMVTRGRYYVGGILCENEKDLKVSKEGTIPTEKGVLDFKLPSEEGNYLAYLDVWERHVSALEDPELCEVALGGPDTTTRTEVAWEVRIRKLPEGQSSCMDAFTEQGERGRMKAEYKRPEITTAPCEITAGEYRRLENQLYRVEVHSKSETHAGTFFVKWSRENASVAAHCVSSSLEGRITLKDAAPHVLDAFRDCQAGTGKWIEISDEIHERKRIPGVTARLLNIEGNDLIIDPDTIYPPVADNSIHLDQYTNPVLRLWDSCMFIKADGRTIDLEMGIQVCLEGPLTPSDYWLIPSRTITDTIEWWPLDPLGNHLFRNPDGVTHNYCPLAILHTNHSGVIELEKDCRELFPPVTAIMAEDVGFDGTVCEIPDPTNVQEALDVLCRRRDGSCTIVVLPSQIENCPSRLQDMENAQICLKASEYRLNNTVVFEGSGNLRLVGCGRGTVIVAPPSKAAFAFHGWESVVVENLLVDARAGDSSQIEQALNGTMVFGDCENVILERVTIQGVPGNRDDTACLGIWNGDPESGSTATASVRISGCDLSPANKQIGILVTNAGRVLIEENTVICKIDGPKQDVMTILKKDKEFRKKTISELFKDMVVDQPIKDEKNYTILHLDSHTVRFKAPAGLGKVLQEMLERAKVPDFNRPQDVKKYLSILMDRVLRDEKALKSVPALLKWLEKKIRSQPAAAQGIVIAGSSATDVRVLHNTITRARQGIHMALSHSNAPREACDSIDRAIISGNTVDVTVARQSTEPSHGIFTGNCRSLVIENNIVRVKKIQDAASVIGIKVFGVLGPMVILQKNHVENADTGILVGAVAKTDPGHILQWLTSDNLTSGASVPISVPPDMRVRNHVPHPPDT